MATKKVTLKINCAHSTSSTKGGNEDLRPGITHDNEAVYMQKTFMSYKEF